MLVLQPKPTHLGLQAGVSNSLHARGMSPWQISCSPLRGGKCLTTLAQPRMLIRRDPELPKLVGAAITPLFFCKWR